MEIEIRKAELDNLDLLMEWRMTVLREVFSIPPHEPMENLEYANRIYYQTALKTGEHIACFAYADNKIVGCGGVCFYWEMPSPDNPNGGCAYLMNIYTVPEYRKCGAGKSIVTWLRQRSNERGIGKIYLETSEKAREFYKKIGFQNMNGYLQYPARDRNIKINEKILIPDDYEME